jgi:hypothetical protein
MSREWSPRFGGEGAGGVAEVDGTRDQMAATNAFELPEEGSRLFTPGREMFGEPIEVDITHPRTV